MPGAVAGTLGNKTTKMPALMEVTSGRRRNIINK